MPVFFFYCVSYCIITETRSLADIFFNRIFIFYRDLLSILTLSMLWNNNSETKEVRQSCTSRFDFSFGIEIRMPICRFVSFSPISKSRSSSFVFFPLFLFLFKKIFSVPFNHIALSAFYEWKKRIIISFVTYLKILFVKLFLLLNLST